MRFLFSVSLFLVFLSNFAQNGSLLPKNNTISTKNIQNEQNLNNEPIPYLVNKAHYDGTRLFLPYFLERIEIEQNEEISPIINAITTKIVSSSSIHKLKETISTNFKVKVEYALSKGRKIAYASIDALRLNGSSYEELTNYSITWNVSSSSKSTTKKTTTTTFANSSVLATGSWYKIGVTKTGVYKIDKQFLKNLGIDVNTVNPKDIRIYGNGGKLLPEKNALFRHDDLQENAIYVSGESDGVLNDNDYILFYGQSSDSWSFKGNSCLRFNHKTHHYIDSSFYFLTVDLGAGKRISNQAISLQIPNKTTASYDFYGFHESDSKNLIKSGRKFFGEYFDINTNYTFNFPIPDAVINDTVRISSGVLSRCATTSTYNVSFNSGSYNVTCGPTNVNYYAADIGVFNENCGTGLLSSDILSITINKQTTAAIGWLDALIFNARRSLVLNANQQFNFRDSRTVGIGNVTQFNMSANGSNIISVWDVTDPFNIKNQLLNISGSTIDFSIETDSLKEFVSFGSTFYSPISYGKIANQNLHAIQQADYLIICPPAFLSQAQRMAQIHQQYDTLTYAIATTEEVYNEFSSGSPDIVGIRDFARMLYSRGTLINKPLKYLLLLGDGSYKNKERYTFGNSALIPTYETDNSWSYTYSYVTDDFFGLMDDYEGDYSGNELVDIGVGRFPVRNLSEATAGVNKIEAYYKKNFNFNISEPNCCNTENQYSMGDWRNWVCFLSDDEDNNEHQRQADSLSNKVARNYKNFNVDRIFADSYVQYSTPGGQRYPDAVNDINRRFEKGSLIFNYTGHGGEVGLGHERYIEVPQILGWNNIYNLPLVVTATCEFSRFDDPDRTSAGEYVFLNPQGGGIGLMTTVRLAYSNTNYNLNEAFYNYALKPLPSGKMPAIGDIYVETKQQIGSNALYRNFVILGDPALVLAYPQHRVYTSTINGNTVSVTSKDTLKALSKVTVTGYVGDIQGNKLLNFNGVVYPTIFDKEQAVTTLSNDGNSSPTYVFKTQKNVLYHGKSKVTNGDFQFSFVVPKDISYQFGIGKVSYYAQNGLSDANGYSNNIVIGGSNPNAVVDNQGPVVRLFMNDTKFAPGGTTNESPSIYAEVADSSGINTVGTGIGHDLVAVLDENTNKPIVLNDYYESDLNSYQSGKIIYPFKDLEEGPHKLNLKVWDVQNNSNISYTDFVVAKSGELALSHVLNYPNPFTTKTKFFIEHNQNCSSLKVSIQIFTISGKVVKSISQTINTEGYRLDGIEWDGKDEYGDKLGKGVYVYKVDVSDGKGKNAEKFEKLVILN